jgi:hypothetical protein
MRSGAAAVALALVAGPATAQGVPPIATDRPDQSESPFVVPRGYAQFEAGALHEVGSGNAGGRLTTVGSILARFGVAAPVELRVGFAGWERATAEGLEPIEGFSDLSLGLKVVLREGEGLAPSIALLGTMLLPVGDAEFRAAGVDPVVRAALAHDLGGAFSLGYNLGAAWVTTADGDAESMYVEALYSVSLARALGSRLGAFVEAFGAVAPSSEYPSSHALDGGVTFGMRPNVQLDAAAGVGLTGDAPQWFVGVGIAVRIPR